MNKLLLTIFLSVLSLFGIAYGQEILPLDRMATGISVTNTDKKFDNNKIFKSLKEAQESVVAAKANRASFDISISIPNSLCEEIAPLGIYLGFIYDQDRIFLNGKLIGSTTDPEFSKRRIPTRPRVYLLPPTLLNCPGSNIISLDVKRIMASRIGLLDPIPLVGPYWMLQEKSFIEEAFSLVQRDLGIIVLSVSIILIALFFRYTTNKVYVSFAYFALSAGCLAICLSGWLNIFSSIPQMVYRLTTFFAISTLFEYSAFLFFLSGINNFLTKKMNIIRFLNMIIAITIAFLITNQSIAVNIYKYALTFYSISIIFCACIAWRFSEEIRASKIFQFLSWLGIVTIMLGFLSDVARAWRLHGFANISPFTSAFGIVILGVLFSSRLVEVFKQAETAKAKEIQLKRNEAIARTTQMLAHDVRKPLSMVKMMLDGIQEAESTYEIKEIAIESIPEVNRAIASVSGMLQDIMEIGAETKLRPEVANPDSLIEFTLNEIFRIYPDSEIAFSYDLRHKHNLNVDTLKIQRVLSNIVGNAVQATIGRGNFWFKTRNVGSENGDIFIEFCLGNSGSYIPKGDLSKLFDAFFTKDKKGGTGLGLAIAQKIVQAHSGKIWCTSEKSDDFPEGKVEFLFTLPCSGVEIENTKQLPLNSKEISKGINEIGKQSSASQKDEDERIFSALKRIKEASNTRSDKLKVLIVDDEAVYKNVLKSRIESSTEVSTKLLLFLASTPTEALEIAKNEAPDICVFDVDLGSASTNGFDIVRDIRSLGSSAQICVHSNRALAEDFKKAIDMGANAFLPKPMSKAHFFNLIATAFEERNIRGGFAKEI